MKTSPELYARLAEAGAPLMVKRFEGSRRRACSRPPRRLAENVRAAALKKEDGRIDWSLDAQHIYNRMRGFQPWPGAFTAFRGKTCQVWGKPAKEASETAAPGALLIKGSEVQVAAGNSTSLQLESVQMEGRKKVTAREFANGARARPRR
jgi:methionyl-tRNA formyltransferase